MVDSIGEMDTEFASHAMMLTEECPKVKPEYPAGIFKKKMGLFSDFVIFFLFKHFENYPA